MARKQYSMWRRCRANGVLVSRERGVCSRAGTKRPAPGISLMGRARKSGSALLSENGGAQ